MKGADGSAKHPSGATASSWWQRFRESDAKIGISSFRPPYIAGKIRILAATHRVRVRAITRMSFHSKSKIC